MSSMVPSQQIPPIALYIKNTKGTRDIRIFPGRFELTKQVDSDITSQTATSYDQLCDSIYGPTNEFVKYKIGKIYVYIDTGGWPELENGLGKMQYSVTTSTENGPPVPVPLLGQIKVSREQVDRKAAIHGCDFTLCQGTVFELKSIREGTHMRIMFYPYWRQMTWKTS